MKNELSSVVDALPGLVWTTLPDGQVNFVNRQWCEYTGLSLKDSCGDGWQVAIHPEDLSQLLECLRSSISGEVEVRMRRFDGEFRWFAFRSNPITDAAGAVVGCCGLSWVTRRKNVEEELRHSEEALDKARSELAHVTRVMSLGALTASIAHEVNQPLSGIITNASTCMRMLDADPPNVDGARETARRRHAIKRSAAVLEDQAQIRMLRDSYESLTPREQEIMRLVVAGMLNKQIGLKLGISEITRNRAGALIICRGGTPWPPVSRPKWASRHLHAHELTSPYRRPRRAGPTKLPTPPPPRVAFKNFDSSVRLRRQM